MIDSIRMLKQKPSVAAHACNPSFAGGEDWEDQDSRPARAKILRDPTSTNKIWMWWCTPDIPAMWGKK